MNNKLFTESIKKEKFKNENLWNPKIKKNSKTRIYGIPTSLHNVWTIKLHLRNYRVQENQQK